jgi:hypothetical protein
VFEPRPVERPVAPLHPGVPAPIAAALPAPVPARASTSRARHRELYDAAYADQLFRNATLRRTIHARLAIPEADE